MSAVPDISYGSRMARVAQSARHKVASTLGFVAGVCAVLTVVFVVPANAAPAACPASYATGEEKLACIQNDNCSLSIRWPAETKRLKWLVKEAEQFLENQLSGSNECVLLGDLTSLFEVRIEECKRREAEVGLIATVTTMLNRDRLVSDRRGISKRTSIGMPKVGDC